MYNMDTMPLRKGHIWILIIASAGQFFGGVLAILVGVIAPLITITHHPELSSWLQGFIFSAGLKSSDRSCKCRKFYCFLFFGDCWPPLRFEPKI